MKISKFLTVFSLLLLTSLIFAQKALAVCPVCTVAVGAGVGLSRYLGIDDMITGLWIGGLTVSMIMWTINWLNGKNIRFKARKIVITLAYYLLIVVPLYSMGIMRNAFHALFGIDKLLLGIIMGSIAFLLAALWYEELKNKNNGHAYFPFQKIAMPVGTLVMLSIIFYLFAK